MLSHAIFLSVLVSVSPTKLADEILRLAPHLEPVVARSYAKHIVRECQAHQLDPLLMTSIIHHETGHSWRASVKSLTHDYGLGQVHVSKTSNAHLLGFEEVLFDPATNLKYAAGILAMWRNYHFRKCPTAHLHPFWSHYQWGYRVRDSKWTKKIGKTYTELQARLSSSSV